MTMSNFVLSVLNFSKDKNVIVLSVLNCLSKDTEKTKT